MKTVIQVVCDGDRCTKRPVDEFLRQSARVVDMMMAYACVKEEDVLDEVS